MSGKLALRVVTVLLTVLVLGVTPVPHTLTEAVQSGRQAAAEGRHSTAVAALSRARIYAPWALPIRTEAMWAAFRAQEWPRVISDLEHLSAMRPLTADEYAALGVAHAELGDDREAVKAWEQAEIAGTGSAEALSRLLEVYRAREEWDRAIGVMERLRPLLPEDAELRYELGVLLGLNDPAESYIALNEAIALDPATYAEQVARMQDVLGAWDTTPVEVAYARLGAAYLTMNEIRLAERAFERAVAFDPTYAEALAYLGYLRALQGAEGLGAVQQALAIAPESLPVLYFSGRTWREYQRPAQARTLFKRGYQLDADNPAFPVEISATYRSESNFSEAEFWLEEAIAIEPEDPRLEILLATLYIDSEYMIEEKGLPLAQRLVAEHGDNAEAQAVLGWALYLTNNLGEAQAMLEASLENDPTLARAHAHLAALMELQGNSTEAVRHYERALTLDPYGPWGAFAERALARMRGPEGSQ